MRPLDLCSVCLVMLQCQQPCTTRFTGWATHSMSRLSVYWHTSVGTVWNQTVCQASARYWPQFLAVLCYVQLKQTNCWSHGPARPALDRVPSGLLAQLPGTTCQVICATWLNFKWLQTTAENCFVPDGSGVVTARTFVTDNLLTKWFEMSVYYYYCNNRDAKRILLTLPPED